jgi:tetratricopeptide (TPR) repeat protein
MMSMSEVKAYNEKRTIKTYLIGDPDTNPFISEYLGSLMFYPYPLKNDVSTETKDVEYNLFCLENEYIEIATIPELGGKLYSAVDKRTNKDIFYCNPVVKPQLIGCTGAWTSGGIEFNFPNRGHRPTVTDYTDTMFREYEDGSAAVIICDIDMISWQWFTVELRLYPGKAYIEQITRMYNPNDYEDSYYFWATSAELEKKGLEWRFPCLWHIEEESRHTYLWPFDEEGKYGPRGEDIRFNDNAQGYTLPFGSRVLRDYMGIYYPDTDSNVIHVADFREVPGKKVWCWGKAPAGINWCKRLTDNDDRYIEVQAGAVETQNEFNILKPHNRIEIKEYWLHTTNNGPLCAASKDVVASYELVQDSIQLSLSATDNFVGAEFVLRAGDDVVFEKIIDLSPVRNVRIEAPFDVDWLDRDIKFSVRTGNEILIQETILENQDALEMIDKEEYVSEDEVRASDFSEAFALEKRRHYNEAIELYGRVIEDNPDYLQAHLRMACCYLKKYDAQKALEILEGVLRANPEDVELMYLYALASWRCGKEYKAAKFFYKVPISSPLSAAASYFISIYHLKRGEYQDALTKLDYSIANQPFHYKSNLLKAYALLGMGKQDEAELALRSYLNGDPMDYVAMCILDEIENSEEYSSLICNRKENIYYVLAFFDEVEDWNRCLAVIDKYIEHGGDYKLLAAYRHYYADLAEGCHRDELINAVNKIALDYVFPNHAIDRKILGSIVSDSPNARYLCGLMQYRAENYDYAKALWSDLVEEDFGYSVLYRNLANYYFKAEKDYHKAIELAEKGLEKAPVNDHLFYILYSCYLELGWEDKIPSLLERIERMEKQTDSCRRLWIDMLNHVGKHEEAVRVLEKTEFRVFEHDPADLVPYGKIYKESYLGVARMALHQKDYDKAWLAVEKCLNIERRYEEKIAEIYFYAGIINEKKGNFSEALKFYNKIFAENISRDDTENYPYLVKAAHRLVKLNWIGVR